MEQLKLSSNSEKDFSVQSYAPVSVLVCPILS
jgi:hypothetical protein